MVYAFQENYVLALSHDEVVHGTGSLFGIMTGDKWQKYANLRLLYGSMFGQVRGYERLLAPMARASSHFHERVLKPGIPTHEHRYRNALFHPLCSQTSCYRYWGSGIWTDYGREICRRLEAILAHF